MLEILLSQDKSADCKKVLSGSIGNIYISDFSLHSIGVILLRFEKVEVFDNFVSDVLQKINIASLASSSYGYLSKFKDRYALDFDDSYQCKLAEENKLAIVTMDKDFERVQKRIKIKFI